MYYLTLCIYPLRQKRKTIIVEVLVRCYPIINSLLYIMSNFMFLGQECWNKCCYLYDMFFCLIVYWSVYVWPEYDNNLNVCTLFCVCLCRMYINHHSQTMKGILKRKFAEVDDNPCYSSSSSPLSSLSSPASSEWESDGESSPSDNQDFTPHSPSPPTSLPSKSPNPWPLFFFFHSLSNNANLLIIRLFSHRCLIGVSLISLQQHW